MNYELDETDVKCVSQAMRKILLEEGSTEELVAAMIRYACTKMQSDPKIREEVRKIILKMQEPRLDKIFNVSEEMFGEKGMFSKKG